MSKLSKSELAVLFFSKEKRSNFINDYEHFNDDGNSSFYKKYIKNNFNTDSTSALIELIELSIKIDFFDRKFFKHLLLLYPHKRFWFRLAVLDYIFNFTSRINSKVCISFCERVLNLSRNIEIRFQSCLILYKIDGSYLDLLIQLVRIAGIHGNHYVLYRVVYFLEISQGLKNSNRELNNAVIEIIRANKLISNQQKKEMLSKLLEDSKRRLLG